MALRAPLALALAAALASSAAAVAGSRPCTSPPAPAEARVEAARQYAHDSGAFVAFAIADERGRVRGLRTNSVFPAASVTKVMLLLAYLDGRDRRKAPLSPEQRRLLSPMIRRSANQPAQVVYRIVGDGGLRRVAQRAGMRRFHSSHVRDGWEWGWGAAEITADDQARFMLRVVELTPSRHRAYVHRLLTTIASDDRWGIPIAAGSRWTTLFKSGSGGPSEQAVGVNQVARLEGRRGAAGLAILTHGSPTYEHAHYVIQRVSELLFGPR